MKAATADQRQLNAVRIDTAVRDTRASTLISIDGVDLLQLQQPIHRPDRSLYPSGPKTFLPADPVKLLSPDSSALLPAALPRPAMVGVCSCGEADDASLWMQVRREGDQVVWEPDPTSERSTIDTSWRFDLLPYLDAVDEGQRSVARWEERPRVLARELRRRRDSLFGFDMGNSRGTVAKLTEARAWASSDLISIVISGPSGTQWFRMPVRADLSDQDIIDDLQRLGTDAVELYGS